MTTIGIDLGGTKVFGVALEGDDVVREAKVATPPEGDPGAVVDAIAACVDDLGGSMPVGAVGLGAPGVVDTSAGVVHTAPNLAGFTEPVALGPLVAEALGVARVTVENDVNCGTVAEHRLGAGRGGRDVLGVFVGTGVGGGVILGGVLRRGTAGLAGEIGHMVVRAGGRRCGCGLAGHLEAYAGRAAMEREARRRHDAGEHTALVELAGDSRMKSNTFQKALARSDAVAVALLDEAVAALGVGLASVVACLDLDLVVVGGGVPDKLGPAFVVRIEEALRAELFVPSSPVRVVPAQLGDRAGAVGAALLARDAEEDRCR